MTKKIWCWKVTNSWAFKWKLANFYETSAQILVETWLKHQCLDWSQGLCVTECTFFVLGEIVQKMYYSPCFPFLFLLLLYVDSSSEPVERVEIFQSSPEGCHHTQEYPEHLQQGQIKHVIHSYNKAFYTVHNLTVFTDSKFVLWKYFKVCLLTSFDFVLNLILSRGKCQHVGQC